MPRFIKQTVPFTFREVPAEVHKLWKISAAARGISMNDYGILAIYEQAKKDLNREERRQADG